MDVEFGAWSVPVNESSSQMLKVEFDRDLFFKIRIDVTLNTEGFNTVTQTIVDGRRLAP